MRCSIGVALAIVLAGSVSTTADNTGLGSQVQLPSPPPLVPEWPRPGRPLFPLPPPIQPAPAVVPPVAQSAVAAGPRVRCGMRMLPVNPNIDPKFVKPVFEAGRMNPAPPAGPAYPPPGPPPAYTMRRITPPIPCQ
jgi:hypothetical protein